MKTWHEFRTWLQFMCMAMRAYRQCGENGVQFSGLKKFGTPTVCILVATGREAWRVVNMSIEVFPRN